VGGALTVPLPETVYAGLAACSHDNANVQTAVFGGVTVEEDGVVGVKERVVEVRCNNDHGISADGKWLAISGSVGKGQSQVFVVAVEGGTPRLVTAKMPSYWHGWSPDGKTLAYCASREGEYDIYTIPAAGGEETRLTTEKGLDDGPEYSPDGQWIAYISYDKSVEGHPANKDVVLNVARADGSNPKKLVTLFGGQGTMNVPNWSPDSRKFAFVSYRLVKKK
jgi:Tol biopolymer transport system component